MYYLAQFYVNDCWNQLFYNPNVSFSIVNVSRCAILSGKSLTTVMKNTSVWYKRIAILFVYPISFLWVLTHPNKR